MRIWMTVITCLFAAARSGSSAELSPDQRIFEVTHSQIEDNGSEYIGKLIHLTGVSIFRAKVDGYALGGLVDKFLAIDLRDVLYTDTVNIYKNCSRYYSVGYSCVYDISGLLSEIGDGKYYLNRASLKFSVPPPEGPQSAVPIFPVRQLSIDEANQKDPRYDGKRVRINHLFLYNMISINDLMAYTGKGSIAVDISDVPMSIVAPILQSCRDTNQEKPECAYDVEGDLQINRGAGLFTLRRVMLSKPVPWQPASPRRAP